MRVDQALYSMLTANAGLTALVAQRLYPGQAPQNEPYPLVLYTRASQKVVMSLTGPVNLNSYSMHFDAYGETYDETADVYDALRAALNGFAGDIGGGAVRVRGIFEETGDDGSESPIHAEESGLFRAGLDVHLFYSN